MPATQYLAFGGEAREFCGRRLRFGGVWWKVLMAFLHNRGAESHEILSLSLGLCSLFTFGVGSILLHRFDAPFKCTVD